MARASIPAPRFKRRSSWRRTKRAKSIFLLGEEESKAAAQAVVANFRQPGKVNAAFEKVLAHWDELLGTIEVRTPDTALDTMLNRWLLYQTLSCRIWARTAFYQSGGAFGFRDQLQDVMALVYSQS